MDFSGGVSFSDAMHVTMVQLDIAWEDKEANFLRVRQMLEASPPSRDSLVVLPEMFSTGFSMNIDATRQGDPAEGEMFLAALARDYCCCVVGGVVGPGGDGFARNEAVAYAPSGELLKRFAKLHPFMKEQTVHSPGVEVVTFPWGGFEIAPFVCYDLRFPESFREAARRRADLMVVIANWPVARVEHWVTLLRARAIENQAYVIGVNRCGSDPDLQYPGRSLVIDPHGEVMADAGAGEGVTHAVVDPAKVAAWRRDFPALRDARW